MLALLSAPWLTVLTLYDVALAKHAARALEERLAQACLRT